MYSPSQATQKGLTHFCKSFAADLAMKRAEGKQYNIAVSRVAKKLVRLIFATEMLQQPD